MEHTYHHALQAETLGESLPVRPKNQKRPKERLKQEISVNIGTVTDVHLVHVYIEKLLKNQCSERQKCH